MQLLRTRTAREDAAEQLRILTGMRPGFAEFNGHLPFVLERLENVWRSINDIKAKPAALKSWWDDLGSDPDRLALREARNSELKRNVRFATESISLPVGDGDLLIGTVSVHGLDADGVEHEAGVRRIEHADASAVILVTFTVGAWAGLEVLPTLVQMLRRLETDIVPTAQKLASYGD